MTIGSPLEGNTTRIVAMDFFSLPSNRARSLECLTRLPPAPTFCGQRRFPSTYLEFTLCQRLFPGFSTPFFRFSARFSSDPPTASPFGDPEPDGHIPSTRQDVNPLTTYQNKRLAAVLELCFAQPLDVGCKAAP